MTRSTMRVTKRDGALEEVSFDKVLRRIQMFSDDLDGADAFAIAQKVVARIYDKVPTRELDELAAQICSSLMTEHPDYGQLAARITISNHHKNTSPSFSETITAMYNAKDRMGDNTPLVSDELYAVVQANKEKLNNIIDYTRDYNFDYFGFKTLERSYLVRVNGVIVERPQHMFMRVAIGIHGADLKDAIETYNLMSNQKFTHATPTLFNAGTPRPQMSSCFLASMGDSIEGIFKTISDVAQISKYAGGIGLHIHDIRARGAYIKGTNGTSTGIIPMLRVLNNTARYVNQGSKRNGSIAVYLEPWHADIEAFLDIRKNHGNEEERCRDLFVAVWVPDLFMKRVQANGDWSLMCPNECPGLSDAVGEEFEALYEKYEAEGRARTTIKAQQLWFSMIKAQIETGTPYICFKDHANRKSNQKNLGTIKSSNLCSEIIEYSDKDETAVCNLGSICLPSFIKKDGSGYDFQELHRIAQVLTKNLNKVIDKNFYPTPETKRSNLRHRPIGIGIQGLADTFALLRMAFDSAEAAELNSKIFETIYHGACTASVAIAKKRREMIEELHAADTTEERKTDLRAQLRQTSEEQQKLPKQWAGAYSSFAGSPASEGKFQFDLWTEEGRPLSGLWDWEALRTDLVTYGMRNSLLMAPMPTASTSQIMGFAECFEPFSANIYQRRTLAGEFFVINKYLIRDLLKMGIWTRELKDRILAENGSIQNIDEIPQEIKDLYKTVWELKMKTLIDLAADRGRFVCQSQSLNLFAEDPDLNRISSMHFYAWRKGLKTGMYYLRTRPSSKTAAFTLDPSLLRAAPPKPSNSGDEDAVCRKEEGCIVCSA